MSGGESAQYHEASESNDAYIRGDSRRVCRSLERSSLRPVAATIAPCIRPINARCDVHVTIRHVGAWT